MDESVKSVNLLNTVADLVRFANLLTGHSSFGTVQLKSGIKEDVAAQKCLFGMNLGNFRFYILLLYPVNHLHTSLCGGVLVILA